ncbi:hypothetical protein [Oceanobacillus kimchii]|uniref:hypothetical protein n=1 Tax=Oceanobacillus kimchii TaxID=746691 RepID=UPI003B02BE60
MKFFNMSITVIIILILFGCNNEPEKDSNVNSVEEPTLIEEHEFGLGKQGEFYRFNKVEDIGTYSTGPITIEIEMMETIKGSMEPEVSFYDKKEYKDMEFIGVQMKFDLNEEVDLDKLSFSNEENIHLITDTGESIDQADQSLSSIIDIATLKNAQIQEADAEPHLRMFIFQLEESTAEEIEEATLIIEAPIDNEGNPVGEDLEIEIYVKEKNFLS